MALVVKNLLAHAGDVKDTASIPGSGRSLGGVLRNPLQCSCLENPWTEGSGRLQSIGSQRVRHDWSDLARLHTSSSEWYQRVRGSLGYWVRNRTSHRFVEESRVYIGQMESVLWWGTRAELSRGNWPNWEDRTEVCNPVCVPESHQLWRRERWERQEEGPEGKEKRSYAKAAPLSTLGTGSLPRRPLWPDRGSHWNGASLFPARAGRECQGQKTALPDTAKVDIPRGKPRPVFTLSPANQALAKDSHISQWPAAWCWVSERGTGEKRGGQQVDSSLSFRLSCGPGQVILSGSPLVPSKMGDMSFSGCQPQTKWLFYYSWIE